MKMQADVSSLAGSIAHRCSIRKFKDVQVDTGKMTALKAYVEVLNRDFHMIKIHVYEDSTEFLKPLFYSFIKNGANTFVIEVREFKFPDYKVQVGIAGELLILKATQLELGTVWLGGDGFSFSSAKAQKAIGTSNNVPIVIPFGVAAQDYVQKSRKNASDISRDWAGTPELLEAMRRAPSALNKQPWLFSGDNKIVRITPLKPNLPEEKSGFEWIDCGIAAAHAIAFLGHKTIEVKAGSIVISE